MIRRKQGYVWAGALCLALFSGLFAILCWKPPDQAVIGKQRIAVNLPLSGAIASFSGQYPDGLRLGIEDACKAHGIPANLFALDVGDNGGKAAQAVSVLQKQNLTGFDVYCSGVSDMSVALVNQVDQLAVPHLLVAFDAHMPEQNPNRIRILPNYRLEGPLYVAYARRRQAKRVYSVTHISPPMEEQFVSIVEPGLRALGVEFQRERIDWNTKEFRTLALKIKEYGPDLILLNAFSAELYPLLGALRNYDLVKDGSVFCVLDFVDLLYNGTPSSELVGIAFAAPYFEVPARSPQKKEWGDRYQRRFGQVPNYVPAYAYDTGRIIVEAYTRYGEITAAGLRAVTPYDGINGTIMLNDHGDLNSTLTTGYVNEKGEVLEIK